MSNGHKLELIVNEAKKETYINYWDWADGSNDATFIIRNGQAFTQEGKHVDLAKELEKLSKTVDAQVKKLYKEKKK